MKNNKVINYFPKQMQKNVIAAFCENCGQGYNFYNISYKLYDKVISFTACGTEELKWEIKQLKEGNINKLIDLDIE